MVTEIVSPVDEAVRVTLATATLLPSTTVLDNAILHNRRDSRVSFDTWSSLSKYVKKIFANVMGEILFK